MRPLCYRIGIGTGDLPSFAPGSDACSRTCDGGEFGVSYASCGAVENVIPVDVKIPGCPPAPEALLRGLLTALQGKARVR